ncbi:MAG: MFS transporter, partial [Peptostreptococcaceae bacterium]
MNAQTINNNQVSNKKKYFMVFVCMFMQAIPFGVAQNIQPLFIPYVVKDFGFSLAGFSLIFTFGAIASAACSPFLGRLFEKINIKILFIVGATVSSLGFLGFGFAKNLPMFYVFSAISQIGCVIFSGLGVPYVINHWFPKKGRGKALGIAFSGGSIGNVFLQQITSQMLDANGASYSYVAFGLFALVCSLPVILLFIRLPKAGEVEVVTDIDNTEDETKGNTFEGLGVKAVTKNKFFWTFAIGYSIIAISIS